MEFYELAQMLYPLISKGETAGEFVRTMLINVVDDECPESKGPYSRDETTLRHYYDGTRKMGKLSREVLAFLDSGKFAQYIESFNDEVQQMVFDALLPYCPDLSKRNLGYRCVELLVFCLQECALTKPGPKVRDSYDRLKTEDSLRRLIRSLVAVDESTELVQLNYEAVKVSRKIAIYPNQTIKRLLIEQITTHVVQYYCFIKEQIGLLKKLAKWTLIPRHMRFRASTWV